MKPKTQKQAIEKHLKDFGHITPVNALMEYGCFRLSHIIYVLRKEGLNIETLNTKSTSKFGNRVNFATYKLN